MSDNEALPDDADMCLARDAVLQAIRAMNLAAMSRADAIDLAELERRLADGTGMVTLIANLTHLKIDAALVLSGPDLTVNKFIFKLEAWRNLALASTWNAPGAGRAN